MWPFGRVGIVLATEEHAASDLVKTAIEAEEHGFGFAFVSDHFHPWNSRQGHSSHLWSLMGALAVSTRKLGLVSAVTCPILRFHPTTLAQAASTVQALSKGRFALGVGTGENLNEHIVGEGWPPFQERLDRLRESIGLIRELLSGVEVNRRGRYFTVENARLFDAAVDLPILMACSGLRSVQCAAEMADGLICLGARGELVEAFPAERPAVAQISVCWDTDHERAVEIAHRCFPEVALDGMEFTRLRTPAEFDQAALAVSAGDVGASIVSGPDPEPYRRALEECYQAGFEAVAIHQIGPRQGEFLEFWRRDVLLI